MKLIPRLRACIIIVLILVLSCPAAFARGNTRGHHPGDSKRVDRGSSHYYRDGRWYRHGWFGFDVVVAALAIGAFIDFLPPRHTTVTVEGVPYFHDDRYYYRPVLEGGYVVVPPPVIVQPPPPVRETATVNIPNSRGGYTPVILKKTANGYIGPQGEYYPEHPTVEQLRTLYGN